MKGQASYQLLVVSPEVRKSKEKERDGEMGVREGKKKDKIVISKLSHALRQSSNILHLRAQGSLANWGPSQEISAGVTAHPKRKKSLGPCPLWWSGCREALPEQQQFRITWELRVRCLRASGTEESGGREGWGGREKL